MCLALLRNRALGQSSGSLISVASLEAALCSALMTALSGRCSQMVGSLPALLSHDGKPPNAVIRLYTYRL